MLGVPWKGEFGLIIVWTEEYFGRNLFVACSRGTGSLSGSAESLCAERGLLSELCGLEPQFPPRFGDKRTMGQ